jgi:hypothetical protein
VAALPASNFMSLCSSVNQRVYALTRTGDVWESTDGGMIWVFKGAVTTPDAIEIEALGASLYVLTHTGDVFRSTDSGASWLEVGTLSQSGLTALARHGTTLLVSTATGEVATSVDGTIWIWRGVINQLTVTALATDAPATSGVPLESAPGSCARHSLAQPGVGRERDVPDSAGAGIDSRSYAL